MNARDYQREIDNLDQVSRTRALSDFESYRLEHLIYLQRQTERRHRRRG